MGKIKNNLVFILKIILAFLIYLFVYLNLDLSLAFTPLSITSFFIIIFIFNHIQICNFQNDITISSIICSLFFSITFVLGREYLFYNIFFYQFTIVKTILCLTQIVVLCLLFLLFLTEIKYVKIKEKNNYFMKILNKNNIFKVFILIMICWIPYMILMYPGFLNADSLFELAQYWKFDNLASKDVVLINQNQLITAHHPVLYTYLIGMFSKFININIGLYVYNILQTLFVIYSISSLLIFVNKRIQNNQIISYMLMIICFFPFVPHLFTSLEKDMLFVCAFIFFIMEIYKILFEEKCNLFILSISSIFLVLLRNNVKYIYFIFILILFFTIKKYRKQILITVSIVIVSLFGMNLFCSINQITSGSKAEMLSVPFQQTARYVKYYEQDVTENEREVIDRVLDYDKLSTEYNPKLSDPIKNTFNQRKPTNDELKDYFKVWFQMFLKHPLCYVEATLNNQIDNFYLSILNVYTERRSYKNKHDITTFEYIDNYGIKTSDFNFKPNATLDKIGLIVDKIVAICNNVPIIGMMSVATMHIWSLLILFLNGINCKNNKIIIFSSFYLLYLGTLLLGPCDATLEFRYILPFFVSEPLYYLIWKNLTD